MIQDLQSSIADLQTDIGTMSTDMADMVTKLVSISDNTSQSIEKLNIKAGDIPFSLFPDVEKEYTIGAPAANTFQKIGTFEAVSVSDGTLKIDGEIYIYSSNNSLVTVDLYKNGVSVGTIGTHTANYAYSTAKPFSFVLAIEKGDKIEFYAKTQNAGNQIKIKLEVDSCALKYELADIITVGGFSIQL